MQKKSSFTTLEIAAFKLCAFFIFLSLILSATSLKAEPPPKNERKHPSSESPKMTERDADRARLIESANGWMYVNNEWVHPDGYKFVRNKILRTTAKPGKPLPKPPGQLALEHPDKLRPRSSATVLNGDDKTAAEKAAETRRKNLAPAPAPQTGTHL